MSDPGCVMCQRVGERGALWIADLGATVAYLNDDQFFPGYTYLISKRHATELYHLTTAERGEMIEELSRVAQALDAVFGPEKMNYELLGNRVPHIHWHVVPRLTDDPTPRSPVWSLPHEPRRLAVEAARERVTAVRSALVGLPA